VNRYGTICAETCYIVVRKILETKPEAVLVCTQQLGQEGGGEAILVWSV
jgi:hypothetical protein